MNFTGEMMASESRRPQHQSGSCRGDINNIFRSAHEASKKIGLDACKETVISTPKGVIACDARARREITYSPHRHHGERR